MKNIINYILCFLVPLGCYYYLDIKDNNFMYLILLFLAILIFMYIKDKKITKYKLVYVFSVFFSMVNVLGKYVYLYNDVFKAFIGFNLFKVLIQIISLGYFLGNIINILFNILSKKDKKKYIKYRILNSKYLLFILWGVILISWIPCFLAYYPGIFAYDMPFETNFIYQGIISKLHPPLHIYFWQLCLFLSKYIKIEALAIYSFLQMFFMSYVCAKVVTFINERTKRNDIVIFSIIFFSINPIVAIISLLSTKDVLFTCVLILFLLEIYKYIENSNNYFKGIKSYIYLIILLSILCLLRNNVIYILIIFGFIMCIYYKRKIWNLLCVFLCGIAIYGFVNNYLYTKIGVLAGLEKEKIPVLIQQIAFVDNLHHDELNDKTLKEIKRYWFNFDDKDCIYINYRFADTSKLFFEEGIYSNDKKGFYNLYFKLFKKYPKDYINAFLTLNVPSWYIDASVSDIYSKRDYIEDYIASNEYYSVKRESKIPIFYKFYSKIANYSYIKEIPIVSVICSISFPIWFLLFVILVCILRKSYDKLLVLLCPLLLWLTYLLGPVSNFRYMIPLFMLFPLFIFIILENKRGIKNG